MLKQFSKNKVLDNEKEGKERFKRKFPYINNVNTMMWDEDEKC